MIDPKLIDDINFNIDIESLMRKHGASEVLRNGDKVRCNCLLHGGTNLNLHWRKPQDKWLWCCHSKCNGDGGDLINFMQKLLGCTFAEAVEELAREASIEIKESDYKPINNSNRTFLNTVRRLKERKQQKNTELLNEDILNTFYGTIHKDLRKEGFDEEIVDRFELGFASAGELEGRITIPIRDEKENLVAISGRATGDIEPKYKIMSNSFKGNTLYNLDKAKDYIKATREMIVVEGFKDVWRLYQFNTLNAVAIMGSSTTAEQEKLIIKYAWDVVLCLDGDEAGRKGTDKLINNIKKYHDVWVVDMPDKKDPGDMLKSEWWYYYSQKRKV